MQEHHSSNLKHAPQLKRVHRKRVPAACNKFSITIYEYAFGRKSDSAAYMFNYWMQNRQQQWGHRLRGILTRSILMHSAGYVDEGPCTVKGEVYVPGGIPSVEEAVVTVTQLAHCLRRTASVKSVACTYCTTNGVLYRWVVTEDTIDTTYTYFPLFSWDDGS